MFEIYDGSIAIFVTSIFIYYKYRIVAVDCKVK